MDETAAGGAARPGETDAQLRAIVERIEHLEEEKRAIAEQVKEVYAEAKAHGYDPKILRKVVSLRKKPAEERDEEEALVATYLAAIGMLALPDRA